jgi:hypothetical protein
MAQGMPVAESDLKLPPTQSADGATLYCAIALRIAAIDHTIKLSDDTANIR